MVFMKCSSRLRENPIIHENHSRKIQACKLIFDRRIFETQINAVAEDDQQHEVVEERIVDGDPNACFSQRVLNLKEKEGLAKAH